MLNLGKISFHAFAMVAIWSTLIIVNPESAQAAPHPCLYINSSGHRIPAVFWGLRPDVQFARAVDRELVSLQRQISVPHFQNLVSHSVCPKPLIRNVGFPQDCPCIGQYMVAQLRNCGAGCTPPYDYDVYFSTGGDQCRGYFIAGDACNGCEYDEEGCNTSCFPCQ
jgi:hypothetical protein